MDKTYSPAQIEARWGEAWEQNGYFAPSGQGTAYTLMLPPPNVTGSLHMGHGFQQTLMDIVIRTQRMSGANTVWQPGTDHAGIATQMVVERQLAADGQNRHDLGREAFIDKIWEWKQHSGNTIAQQMRRLGVSPDWSRERFTMDPELSAAVQHTFIQLYREGLIYRGKRLVNWDPVFKTAISDLEVINQEEAGSLWHIRYPLTDGSGEVVVATTRPETLLGDSAIAVHPDDKRYQHLIGKTANLPLTDRHIPIIADDAVEIDFGSGCVKITPAHDFNDYAMGKRHDLPQINILNPDATLNDNTPSSYQGLDRFVARKQILADLDAQGLLVKTEDHTPKVPRGDRSGAVIEPYLTDQWFVKAEPLAKPAIEAVKSGEIEFFPANWQNTYFQWLENIEDWCISRQLWWGHRVPAWYDADGNHYVGKDEAEVRSHYQLGDSIALSQDEDVLDTWFSSALWPFSTLGWPEQTIDLETFFPTQLLITGFDIIFFWVARMVMMSLHLTGKIPFKHIYITGLIRDQQGQKMSKSKGNVLDPIDLVDGIGLDALLDKRTQGMMQPEMANRIRQLTQKAFPQGIAAHGTDAVRFTFCALASTGRDIRFDLDRLTGYRNFCNKLWNAARYVLMNTEGQDFATVLEQPSPNIVDRWILSRLQHAIAEAETALTQYRFDLLANHLHDFVWHAFCDWYLELSKPTLWADDNPEAAAATRATLVTVLETICRLLHPIMPFITEEIWQQIAPLAGKSGESIMLAPYPVADDALRDDDADTTLAWMQQLISGIRTIRAEMQISPAQAIPLLLHQGSTQDKELFNNNVHLIEKLAKISESSWHDRPLPPAAIVLVGELQCGIPLQGLIDKHAELERLNKRLTKLQTEIDKQNARLNNRNYVDNAPAELVEQARQELAALEHKHQQLSATRSQIEAMPEEGS